MYTKTHALLLVTMHINTSNVLHQRSITASGLKSLSGTLLEATIVRSSSVSFDSWALLSVLITSTCEKICSTLPLLDGREKRSSMSVKKLAQFAAHGALKILHQAAPYGSVSVVPPSSHMKHSLKSFTTSTKCLHFFGEFS